eukprot:scaffold99334_cov56-Attheya_sp.AAC.4
MVSPSPVISPVLPSVIRTPRRSFVRCFFAIGCRSWTSGNGRLTLNVTRIGIIYRSKLFAAGVRRLLLLDNAKLD